MCGGRLADLGGAGVKRGAAESSANRAQKPSPPKPDYYLLADGQPQGPYPQAQILEWIAARRIGPASLGWRAGLDEWMPLDEILELAGAFEPILPTPIPVSPD
ncbi:MAG: DUF4339 domain-containing protein [Methylomagnum sp.]